MTITNPAHIGRCWCGDKPTADSVGDWDTADHYLRHGKSPHSRPLAHNTRVLRLWDGDIGVRLHSTVVVVYPRPVYPNPGGYDGHDLVHQNKGGELHTHGVVAWFTLGGYNNKLTRDRVTRFTPAWVDGNSHTPWPYLVHSEGLPRTPLNSNETVAVDKWGKMVASAHDYPMDTHVHELARVPYVTTKAMPGGKKQAPGGKKQATVHFEDDGAIPEPDPDYTPVWAHYYKAYTKPPEPQPAPSPQVDGNKVIAAMGSVVPDMGRKVECPGHHPGAWKCSCEDALSDMIIHLNDQHKWPREAIADWLESLDLDLELRERSTA